MFNKTGSWKSSLFGILGGLALMGVASVNEVQAKGQPINLGNVGIAAAGLALAALGKSSKDADVTGGSRPNNTPPMPTQLTVEQIQQLIAAGIIKATPAVVAMDKIVSGTITQEMGVSGTIDTIGKLN